MKMNTNREGSYIPGRHNNIKDLGKRCWGRGWGQGVPAKAGRGNEWHDVKLDIDYSEPWRSCYGFLDFIPRAMERQWRFLSKEML